MPFELCGTERFFRELGKSRVSAPMPKCNMDIPLNQWYVHLFFHHRRKAIVLAHPRTGWVIYKVNQSREDIRNLSGMVHSYIRTSLIEHGFNAEAVDKAIDAPSEVRFCRTNDRLGTWLLSEAKRMLPNHWLYPINQSQERMELAWGMYMNFGPCGGRMRFAYEEMAGLLGVDKPKYIEAREYCGAALVSDVRY